MTTDATRPDPVLSIRDLSVVFTTSHGEVEAVRHVDLDVAAGETVAIVGESGSGKSTVVACVNRLLADNGRITGGVVRLGELDLTAASERTMTSLRGSRIGLVPQDPMTNLDPVMTVGDQIVEALEVHDRARGRAAHDEAVRLLEAAGIDDAEPRFHQYPHEFSGGHAAAGAHRHGPRVPARRCCSPTSPPRRSTSRCSGSSSTRWPSSPPTSAPPSCSSRTTSRSPRSARTGSSSCTAGRSSRPGRRSRSCAAPSTTTPGGCWPPRPGSPIRRSSPSPRERADVTDGAPAAPLLEVRRAVKRYALRGRPEGFRAVDEVDLVVGQGETVAIVGESGSGKSTTARLALRLETADGGSVQFRGEDVSVLRGRDVLAFRRAVQPVFQNPYASLDPRYTIAQVVAEPLTVHKLGDRASRRQTVLDLLEQVALPATLADRYPHELSGGQRQRVAIARALALRPELVVMDEAVSALDVIVQEQILDLMVSLQRDLGLSFLFISHDLAVVRLVAHRVYVMREGRVVESGVPEQIFTDPQEDYTKALVAAVPGRRSASAS